MGVPSRIYVRGFKNLLSRVTSFFEELLKSSFLKPLTTSINYFSKTYQTHLFTMCQWSGLLMGNPNGSDLSFARTEEEIVTLIFHQVYARVR